MLISTATFIFADDMSTRPPDGRVRFYIQRGGNWNRSHLGYLCLDSSIRVPGIAGARHKINIIARGCISSSSTIIVIITPVHNIACTVRIVCFMLDLDNITYRGLKTIGSGVLGLTGIESFAA